MSHLPAVRLDEAAARRLRQGQAVASGDGVPPELPVAPGPCRVYSGAAFVGLAEVDTRGLRPLRLLHADPHEARRVPR